MNRIHIRFRFPVMKNSIILFSLIVLGSYNLAAQDTLPKFSLKNAGNNRIILGWTNKFEDVKQISIQRSFDSVKNFKTIFTVVDPTLPENGYLDTKATNDHMFYRLYIMLGQGTYLFSDTKRPVFDSSSAIKRIETNIIDPAFMGTPNDANGSVAKSKTDTWIPSRFVYTQKDGTIKISLPDADSKKYNIKFFTFDDEMLFELKDVSEKSFKIDKSNFYQSGWFKFELYENGELKEKNKFYLPKEF